MPSYVLDTSAILCVLFQEVGADTVVELLDRAGGKSSEEETRVFVPFIALMEMEYWLRRRLSPRELQDTLFLVENWPAQVIESSPDWRHEAARVKAMLALSVADAWIASLAILRGSELVHKDPEFDQMKGLEALRLPYKGGMA